MEASEVEFAVHEEGRYKCTEVGRRYSSHGSSETVPGSTGVCSLVNRLERDRR